MTRYTIIADVKYESGGTVYIGTTGWTEIEADNILKAVEILRQEAIDIRAEPVNLKLENIVVQHDNKRISTHARRRGIGSITRSILNKLDWKRAKGSRA